MAASMTAKDSGEIETGISHFGALPFLVLERPELEPVTGRVSNIVLDPINDQEAMILRLWTLALRLNRDTFAYQSLEEKFPGDLKVSPSGMVEEYRAKTSAWEAIFQISEGGA